LATIVTGFLELIALFWLVQGFRAFRGMSRIPQLSEVTPPTGGDWPRISILFAARDEAEKLPAALATMLAQDYANYEVIAVDDRSSDATPEILDALAREHSNLKVVHVRELPEGWLGKPHALDLAYKRATGDWLVFTDADVRFAPDLLRRAMSLARTNRWDHLTLLALIDLVGFWETVAVVYLGVGFVFGVQPWRVSDPDTGSYMGVGAFQLLRRTAYESIGTHRRLAMEVVDDMKLGKLVKQGGFRSGVASSDSYIRLRWQDGFGDLVNGLTKNLFAGFGYSVGRALFSIFGIFAISILPFVALPFATGLARIAAAVSVIFALALHVALTRPVRISPLYALTHPLGAALFIYMLLRSMIVTLWRRGVLWRDTFYPLDELKRGVV
jgi:glycosyltransferase involved in cell wall biosynthesis